MCPLAKTAYMAKIDELPATAHWLAHAMALLQEDEIVEIWDRDVKPGMRHVWPTLKARKDGIWLVTLEPNQARSGAKSKKADRPSQWLGGCLGAIHTAGAGVLGFFLGADRAAPVVREAEKPGDRI